MGRTGQGFMMSSDDKLEMHLFYMFVIRHGD